MEGLTPHIIKEALLGALPGEEAHGKMMSYNRPIAAEARTFEVKPKESAVLMMLYHEHDELQTIFMLRPQNQGVHSGQISFPGGKREIAETLMETAFRETFEEVGIAHHQIEILGELSEVYIPPSNFLVQPFVGYLKEKPSFIPNPAEVEKVITFPVKKLFAPETLGQKEVVIAKFNKRLTVPYFDIEGHALWGATAMIVAEFKQIMFDFVNSNPLK